MAEIKPLNLGKEKAPKKVVVFLLGVATLKRFPKSKGLDEEYYYASKIDGAYICHMGDYDLIKTLIKFGITEQIQSSTSNPDGACNIGFNPIKKKWYGWSHRGACGFEIGDKIFEANFGDDNTSFLKHGSKTIKTLDDAKKAAINFANYIG